LSIEALQQDVDFQSNLYNKAITREDTGKKHAE
jgi:hypothetical protein